MANKSRWGTLSGYLYFRVPREGIIYKMLSNRDGGAKRFCANGICVENTKHALKSCNVLCVCECVYECMYVFLFDFFHGFFVQGVSRGRTVSYRDGVS